MSAPLIADLPLAQRVEAGWAHVGLKNTQTLNRLAPELGARSLAVGGGLATFLGAGSPLSQAQGLGMHGAVPDEAIDAMERFFQDLGGETRIEVASLADPSMLVALSLRGYLIVEQTHSLALRMNPARPALPAPAQRENAAEIQIVPVQEEAMEDWVDVIMGCFFEPPETPPPLLREGALAMARSPGNLAWLALVNGEPAGGASMFLHEGLALFSGDGTRSGFRGRGIQGALLHARLAHAASAGCDLATICTQPASGSQRNAERAGFQVIYARTMMLRGGRHASEPHNHG